MRVRRAILLVTSLLFLASCGTETTQPIASPSAEFLRTTLSGPYSPLLESVLLIDEDSFDNGAKVIEELASRGCGGGDPAVCVNDDIANPGVRDPLPIPIGTIIGRGVPGGTLATLRTGQIGDEGWFKLTRVPRAWSAAGPDDDGIVNFLLAEAPGFGRNGEHLLDKIRGVTPLRTQALKDLVGRSFCAVVYDSDISINYEPLQGNLQGATLGRISFTVLAVGEPNGSELPDVTIQIADPFTCVASTPQ